VISASATVKRASAPIIFADVWKRAIAAPQSAFARRLFAKTGFWPWASADRRLKTTWIMWGLFRIFNSKFKRVFWLFLVIFAILSKIIVHQVTKTENIPPNVVPSSILDETFIYPPEVPQITGKFLQNPDQLKFIDSPENSPSSSQNKNEENKATNPQLTSTPLLSLGLGSSSNLRARQNSPRFFQPPKSAVHK